VNEIDSVYLVGWGAPAPLARRAASAFLKQYQQLVARAWGDPAFKARLLADPTATLTEMGLDVLPGLRARRDNGIDARAADVQPAVPRRGGRPGGRLPALRAGHTVLKGPVHCRLAPLLI
jgi:hypothetical protein